MIGKLSTLFPGSTIAVVGKNISITNAIFERYTSFKILAVEDKDNGGYIYESNRALGNPTREDNTFTVICDKTVPTNYDVHVEVDGYEYMSLKTIHVSGKIENAETGTNFEIDIPSGYWPRLFKLKNTGSVPSNEFQVTPGASETAGYFMRDSIGLLVGKERIYPLGYNVTNSGGYVLPEANVTKMLIGGDFFPWEGLIIDYDVTFERL